jgi:hypothetical protein
MNKDDSSPISADENGDLWAVLKCKKPTSMNDNKVTIESKPKYQLNYPTLTPDSVQNFFKHADNLIERSIGGPYKFIGICEPFCTALCNTIGGRYRGYEILSYGHNVNELYLL